MDAEGRVHEQTRKVREGINAPGVLGKLVDLAAGRSEQHGLEGEAQAFASEIESFCSEVELESCCSEMKDSWEDALDGILAVEVRFTKS